MERVTFKQVVLANLKDITEQLAKLADDQKKGISSLTKKIEKMGKVNDEMLSLLKEMDTETTEISEKLDEYLSKVEGVVDPATVEGFKALSVRLKGLGKDPQNPIPTPEPTPNPAPTPEPTTPTSPSA